MKCWLNMNNHPITLTVLECSQSEMFHMRAIAQQDAILRQASKVEVFFDGVARMDLPPAPRPEDKDGPTGMTPEEFQHGVGELMAKFMAQHSSKPAQDKLMSDIKKAIGKKKPKPGRRSK